MSSPHAESSAPIAVPVPPARRREQMVRLALWLGLGALALVAFWPLLSFDPRAGVVRATPGLEGALFEPTGEDPRLIAVLALWLLFTRRGRIAAAWRDGLGQGVLGGTLLGGAVAVAVWATWVSAPDLLVHALQLCVLGGAAMLGGSAGLRAVWLPAAFLFLAVPVPAALLNALLLPLQLATVQVCAHLLAALGFEAWGIGDQLIMQRGIFHVIESCSGVRLVQTLLMASLVYAELFARRAPRALALLLCAPLLGLCVNFARILSIVFNPYAAISSVHTTQGVLMVVLGVLLLAGIDRTLERLWPSLPRPIGERAPLLDQAPDLRFASTAAVLAVLAVGVWTGPSWQPPASAAAPIGELPSRIDGLVANGTPLDLVFLGSVHFSDRIHRTYAAAAVGEPAPVDAAARRSIELLLGEDDHLNRRGSLLSDKTTYPGRGWQLVGQSSVEVEPGLAADLLLFIGTGRTELGDRRMLLHWREGFGSPAEEGARAFLGLDRSDLRRSERALVWRVSTQVAQGEDLEAVRDELVAFARSARRAWDAVLAGVPRAQ